MVDFFLALINVIDYFSGYVMQYNVSFMVYIRIYILF